MDQSPMIDPSPTADRSLKERIRDKYATIAQAGESGCCGPSSGGCRDASPITVGLYTPDDSASLPPQALAASLGCGNPTALAELSPGEVVLDLGSGAGIDVLLSARRVAPGGKAYGLDMTDEMLALARRNAARAGVTNAEFHKGEIEAIPLPDEHVDVIISNCVINLSTNKDAVLAEAFRVLKPGGRLAVSDVVVRDGFDLPGPVRKSLEAWAGCVAGALGESEYRVKLAAAGFESADVEITRVYDRFGDTGGCCQSGESDDRDVVGGGDLAGAASSIPGGALAAAFIRARKPVSPGVRRSLR